jgi:hypothetical protein
MWRNCPLCVCEIFEFMGTLFESRVKTTRVETNPALAELRLKVIYEGEEPLPLGSPPRTFR